MRLTVVGSGDAFGTGGRLNTCFHLNTAKGTLLVDCGATALAALKAHALDPNGIDAVVLSHLHGDHFGGLPFLLLDGQFLSRREKPLLIAGPPGTRARLDALLEAFFPKSTGSQWKFRWEVMEVAPGQASDVFGHSLLTAAVIHQSGAPSTALRISDGQNVFAYSGDTEWTDALLAIAAEADLFVCECYAYEGRITGHMSWEILKPRISDLRARRLMVTHMGPTALANLDAIRAAGVLIAADGFTTDV